MKRQFTIRQMSNWDRSTLKRVREVATGGSDKFGMYNAIDNYLDKSIVDYEDFGCKYYIGVLKEGNRIVGSSMIRTSEKGLVKTACMIGVYVGKRFRLHGRGRYILNRTIQKIHQLGRTKISFWMGNHSRLFWQSFGIKSKLDTPHWETKFVRTLEI